MIRVKLGNAELFIQKENAGYFKERQYLAVRT